MKKITLSLLFMAVAWPLCAQAQQTDDAAERARIAAERKAMEARYQQERTACYQKFAVTGCLEESRQRRRVESDALKQQETALNDAERQRRTDAEKARMRDKNSPAAAQQAQQQREQAQTSQQARERQAAEHAASRQAAEAQTAAQQHAFDAKQARHAQEQAQRAEQASQADVQRKRYEDKQKKVQDEQADAQRRAAQRTKPRAAPLPPAPAMPE